MNKTQITKQINGINEEYKEVVKTEEFKNFKKALKVIDNFTTKLKNEEDTTTKSQKIVINNNMLDCFKNLAIKICNKNTIEIVKNATNNQTKKALAIAICDNTTNTLKLQTRTKTNKFYGYEDVTRVFATFKATIENLKTQNKKLGVLVDIVTNTIKFVDFNKTLEEMRKQKELEKQNAKIARKNKKEIENKKASKK